MTQNIPVPAHCKPWIDGQSVGLRVVWPFDTVTLTFDSEGKLEHEIENHVAQFADGYFSINPLYFFRTQNNVGLYIVPDEESSLYSLTVHGVIETDWYRPAPFFVFQNPWDWLKESCVILKKGSPLVKVVPIVIDKGLARMTDVQFEDQLGAANKYFYDRAQRPDLIWKSNTGSGFSKFYKERSRDARSS